MHIAVKIRSKDISTSFFVNYLLSIKKMICYYSFNLYLF